MKYLKSKKHTSSLIVVIIILLVLGITFYKFSDILVPLVIQNEKIGVYEMKKMLECKVTNESNLDLTINDRKLKIPLPNGATKFKNEQYPNDNQYLISLKYVNIEDYINTTLSQNDYLVEQYGGEIFIKDVEKNLIATMYISTYTRNYMRITFEV